MRETSRRLMWLLPGLLLLTGTAACNGSTPASGQSPPRTQLTAPSPAASSVAPADAARQAYLGMWNAFVVASQTANYQSPELSKYAAGDALSVLTRGLYKNYQQGIVTRGQPSFNPKVTVTSQSGGQPLATVTDCADNSSWRNYYRSGKSAGAVPAGRHRILARLQLFDGVWKVTFLLVDKPATC